MQQALKHRHLSATWWEEEGRFDSVEEAGLKWRERRKHVDKVAAMFILQDYLDLRPGRPISAAVDPDM